MIPEKEKQEVIDQMKEVQDKLYQFLQFEIDQDARKYMDDFKPKYMVSAKLMGMIQDTIIDVINDCIKHLEDED